MRGFFRELKDRRVYRVALAYGVVASGLVQIGGTILPIFAAPPWVQQVFVVLVAVGFPFALVLAWAFDITSSGIQRTPNISGLRVSHPRQVWTLAGVGTAIAALALGAYWFWHPWRNPSLTNHPVPEKSIAVLPFENLSTEKENAFFADGVQDQILTDLAKVADLKVIGHTSVQQYKGDPERNRSKIGEQLGVAYLLEGSVQRSERRLRIIAHLIDARSNAQLWAETYDRELADVFTIQSEIAQEIVRSVAGDHLSPGKGPNRRTPDAKTWRPTTFICRRRNWSTAILNASDPKASFFKAIRLLDEATARDPSFVLAYCLRCPRARPALFSRSRSDPGARIRGGQVAAETALRLAPDSAEAHLSMADYYFRCQRDYHRAEKELALARPAMPNSVPFLILSGYLHRRRRPLGGGQTRF